MQELNVKAKNWKDLVTDEPFTRGDLITIQDPLNLGCKELSKFQHVVKNLSVSQAAPDPVNDFINCSNMSDTHRALASLGSDMAKEAFNAGGGGKKSEVERVLAAAKQVRNL
jgi:peptidyl-prolyl cis-trans isomerase-like protein 2